MENGSSKADRSVTPPWKRTWKTESWCRSDNCGAVLRLPLVLCIRVAPEYHSATRATSSRGQCLEIFLVLVEKEPEASFDKHLAARKKGYVKARRKRRWSCCTNECSMIYHQICFTVTGRKSNQGLVLLRGEYKQLTWLGYLPVVYKAIYIRSMYLGMLLQLFISWRSIRSELGCVVVVCQLILKCILWPHVRRSRCFQQLRVWHCE